MKHFFFLLFVLFSCSVEARQNESALMPMPNNIVQGQGASFVVNPSKVAIYVNDSQLSFAAEKLQSVFLDRMGVEIQVSESSKSAVRLLIDSQMEGKEHYVLEVDKKGLLIKGATRQAIFYGIMTLDQLLLGDVCQTQAKKITPVKIDDAPRFPFRALMLDPARHFLPVKDVKFYIDQMARYKYNALQLHLTDDQGWRMEIKKRPELASKEHYTQEELKDLVEYAALRNVEIIPEIDVPGHTASVLSVYPELKCTSADSIEIEVGKTFNLMLCAADEKVYAVYSDVIAEVADVFTSDYIHLGGDESHIDSNWAKCKDCTEMMKREGYQKPSQLMIPFFNRIFSMLKQHDKKAVLWCELDNIYYPANDYLFPYPKDVVLVSWRYGLTPTCIDLTHKYGNQLILAPGEYAYLDYPQLKGDLPEFDNWGMPVTTLEKCYQFDPGYQLENEKQQHLLGVMGTLWGEAMKDINRVTYMTYPRGFALAEAGWTQMEHREWESFKSRLYPNLSDLMKEGVFVRVPFEIVKRDIR